MLLLAHNAGIFVIGVSAQPGIISQLTGICSNTLSLSPLVGFSRRFKVNSVRRAVSIFAPFSTSTVEKIGPYTLTECQSPQVQIHI